MKAILLVIFAVNSVTVLGDPASKGKTDFIAFNVRVTNVRPLNKIEIFHPNRCGSKFFNNPNVKISSQELAKIKQEKACWISRKDTDSKDARVGDRLIFYKNQLVLSNSGNTFKLHAKIEDVSSKKQLAGDSAEAKNGSPETTVNHKDGLAIACFTNKPDRIDPYHFSHPDPCDFNSKTSTSANYQAFDIGMSGRTSKASAHFIRYLKGEMTRDQTIKALTNERLSEFIPFLSKVDPAKSLKSNCTNETLKKYSATVQFLDGTFVIDGALELCPMEMVKDKSWL